MRPSDAVIILAGMAAILAIYSASRVQAQEACMPVSAAVEAAEAIGGHMIDLIDIPGQVSDQLLIAVANGHVQMWGVRDGCMVGRPTPLDAVAVEDTGQPA